MYVNTSVTVLANTVVAVVTWTSVVVIVGVAVVVDEHGMTSIIVVGKSVGMSRSWGCAASAFPAGVGSVYTVDVVVTVAGS